MATITHPVIKMALPPTSNISNHLEAPSIIRDSVSPHSKYLNLTIVSIFSLISMSPPFLQTEFTDLFILFSLTDLNCAILGLLSLKYNKHSFNPTSLNTIHPIYTSRHLPVTSNVITSNHSNKSPTRPFIQNIYR